MRVLGKSTHGTTVEDNVAGGEPLDDRPRSVYEVVTRQMLEQVKADVKEVKDRVNTLLWIVAGAVVLEVVMRVIGG
jgi:hypothetical protein